MDPKQAYCLYPDDRPSGDFLAVIPPDAQGANLVVCPNCGRQDTLVFLQDFVACAACGYSSEGIRGCT